MTAHIQLNCVSKRYRKGQNSFRLGALFRRQNSLSHDDYHWAVRDVSFTLEAGESLGIIGPNGAGKTTLLKLLSRVTKPTDGNILLNGRLSALIELGAGFHPELTGRENIYLNGAILGMRSTEIDRRFDQIVEFSGVGSFLDTPVKRYSSGMYARLGFSIAAHVEPEILLVDEVLAVGDHAFQMKCYAHMDKLRTEGTALIFVSHNMEAVRRVCSRGLVMYRGRPIYMGSAAEAVVEYSDAVRMAARETEPQAAIKEGGLSQRILSFDAEIEDVALLNEHREGSSVLYSGTAAYVIVDVHFKKNIASPIFGFFVRTPDGQRVYATTTKWQKITTPHFKAGERRRVEFKIDLPLASGLYEFGVDVAAPDLSMYYDRMERALAFNIIGQESMRGIADLRAQILFPEFNAEEVLA